LFALQKNYAKRKDILPWLRSQVAMI